MSLSFEELRAANVARCGRIWHQTDEWSPSDWATAMGGECGEAQNEVKKLRRIAATPEAARDQYPPGSDEICRYGLGVERLKAELADMVIYADLLAERMGIDLSAAVVAKFNKVSAENGCDVALPAQPNAEARKHAALNRLAMLAVMSSRMKTDEEFAEATREALFLAPNEDAGHVWA